MNRDQVDAFLAEADDVIDDWEGSTDSASWSGDGSHEVDEIGGDYYGQDRWVPLNEFFALSLSAVRRRCGCPVCTGAWGPAVTVDDFFDRAMERAWERANEAVRAVMESRRYWLDEWVTSVTSSSTEPPLDVELWATANAGLRGSTVTIQVLDEVADAWVPVNGVAQVEVTTPTPRVPVEVDVSRVLGARAVDRDPHADMRLVADRLFPRRQASPLTVDEQVAAGLQAQRSPYPGGRR